CYQGEITPCTQSDISPRPQLAPAHRLVALTDLQRATLARTGEVTALAVYQCLAGDVAPRLQRHVATSLHLGRSQVDVLARGQHDVAPRLDGGHRMGSLAGADMVAVIEGAVGASAQGLCPQSQIATSSQLDRTIDARIADLRGLLADVTAGHHRQHAIAAWVGHIQSG